jgi:hypothetical protein
LCVAITCRSVGAAGGAAAIAAAAAAAGVAAAAVIAFAGAALLSLVQALPTMWHPCTSLSLQLNSPH